MGHFFGRKVSELARLLASVIEHRSRYDCALHTFILRYDVTPHPEVAHIRNPFLQLLKFAAK